MTIQALTDGILKNNPIPSNIRAAKEIDSYLRNMLVEQERKYYK